ncbi:UNVERIFIED_CONTAM: hypothetical protein N8J90_18000 [Halobacillus marinus]|uniref:hypothetical protein n=1 Tax=Bacillus sp. SB49 TaxID=1071080 RepID=UPI0003FFBDF8|nr:hypothetical protein [Bacillus sp. SB49]QHT47983.1 hypothetical protein M662_16335 [Bacillus sp. SB49]
MKEDLGSSWEELVELAMESSCSKAEFRRFLEERRAEDAAKRRREFHVVPCKEINASK